MPNHVTNYVRIAGPPDKLAQLLAKVISKPEKCDGIVFDFNAIIPMPAELHIESGSQQNMGMAAFEDEHFKKIRDYPWFTDRYPGVETKDALHAVLAEKEPAVLELGRQAAENGYKYGHTDWYGWSIEHWGTKWNAYDASVMQQEADWIALRFDTAWSPPEPILDAIVEMGFDVCSLWFDEGGPEGHYGDPWGYFHVSKVVELC